MFQPSQGMMPKRKQNSSDKMNIVERNQMIGACTSLRESWGDEAIVCNLPDADFTTGTPMAIAFEAAGFVDSPRTVINTNDWWNLTLNELQEELENHFDLPNA
jgi:hypothetical protein